MHFGELRGILAISCLGVFIMNVKVDITGIDKVIDRLNKLSPSIKSNLRVTQKVISKKIINDAKNIIRRELNDKHQHISTSMFSEVSSDGMVSTIYIDKDNKPAIYQHEGTKDHMVEPKGKKALYWIDGKKWFSKGHMVSGVKKIKFLYRSYTKNKRYIIEKLEQAVKEALR